jgi:glutamate racemase
MNTRDKPFGIFDSGVGGLTVVRAFHDLLPKESIIYLGDTARVPYGNKSKDTVIRFSREISQFLLSKEVKAIVVACNTASAHALSSLKQEFSIPVFGVIEPGVQAALSATRQGRIGIIGTTGTIKSAAYQNALLTARPDLHLVAEATPLLVPLIEEDWLKQSATRLVLEEYLKPFREAQIDTLVLACTHYPLLKPLLQELLGTGVRLVDSAESCARYVQKSLVGDDWFSHGGVEASDHIYLTDQPTHFTTMAGRFLEREMDSVEVVQVGNL